MAKKNRRKNHSAQNKVIQREHQHEHNHVSEEVETSEEHINKETIDSEEAAEGQSKENAGLDVEEVPQKKEEILENNTHETGDSQESASGVKYKEPPENIETPQVDLSKDEEAKKSIGHLSVNITLHSSTPGPYSLHTLIKKLSVPENQHITAIQAFESNIYIGTSHGEILHYKQTSTDSFQQPEFSLVSSKSFHASRQHPISQIVILPTIQQAAITSASLLQIFSLPSLDPSDIGKIKDVNHITLDSDHKAKEDAHGVHLVVYTTNKIRIVNVTTTALRLVKDIAYGGAISGSRRGDFSVVCGNTGEYDLIDLENDGKIPLFPLKTDGEYGKQQEDESGNNQKALKPFIAPVSHNEFLLTCGTNAIEPAMALIVNSDGDISRGTIPFEEYPNSLEVDDLLVIAAFDKSEFNINVINKEKGTTERIISDIVIYSIHDQSEVQRFKLASDSDEKVSSLKILKLSSGFKQNHDGLVQLIKLVPVFNNSNDYLDTRLEDETLFAYNISKIESNLIIYSNNKIDLLVPEPRLERLFNQIISKLTPSLEDTKSSIISNKINIEEFEDELQSTDSSTELGCVEIEFLNVLIGLTHLKNHNYSDSVLEHFTNGTINPRILIGIVDSACVFGLVWLFNGLLPLVESVKDQYNQLKEAGLVKRKELNEFNKFFEKFLENWTNKHFIEDVDLIKSLEITKLKWNIGKNDQDLSKIVSHMKKYEEVEQLLKDHERYRVLSTIYLQKEKYFEALVIYKGLIDGKLKDLDRSKEIREQTLLLIIDLIYKHFSTDENVIEEFGKWLLKTDVKKGISFFSNLRNDSSSTSDELMILSQIDDLGLQLEFVEKILVRLKRERNLTNLKKNLYKGLLRSLS